jgi:hypothetical protein
VCVCFQSDITDLKSENSNPSAIILAPVLNCKNPHMGIKLSCKAIKEISYCIGGHLIHMNIPPTKEKAVGVKITGAKPLPFLRIHLLLSVRSLPVSRVGLRSLFPLCLMIYNCFKFMILFVLSFTRGIVHLWTFPICGAKLDYCLVLSPLF